MGKEFLLSPVLSFIGISARFLPARASMAANQMYKMKTCIDYASDKIVSKKCCDSAPAWRTVDANSWGIMCWCTECKEHVTISVPCTRGSAKDLARPLKKCPKCSTVGPEQVQPKHLSFFASTGGWKSEFRKAGSEKEEEKSGSAPSAGTYYTWEPAPGVGLDHYQYDLFEVTTE